MSDTNENATELNDKEIRFCHEYCIDLDKNRAYKAVYPKEKTDESVYTLSARMLGKVGVAEYIATIQKDLSKLSGVTALRNILELKKIAYTNIGDLQKGWHKLKDWEGLTDDQKAAISEIAQTETTFGENGEKKTVKIKLHNKLDAIEKLNRMLGFNAPEKLSIRKDKDLTEEEIDKLLENADKVLDE